MTTTTDQPNQIAKIYSHKNQQKLIDHLELKNQVYIVGPTGSGKSQGVKLAAQKLNLPFYKKLVGNQTTETSILGYMDASGKYVEGIAYKPFTEGGLLLIDEVDNGNPNTNLVINGLSDRAIAFPVGMREAHENFILVATANTVGNGATINYCGRNRLDAALLNRFIFINWPYDEELEFELASEAYLLAGGPDVKNLKNLMFDVKNIRKAIEELNLTHIISPRTSVQAAKMLASGKFDIKSIFGECLAKGLDDDSKKKILQKSKLVEQYLETNNTTGVITVDGKIDYETLIKLIIKLPDADKMTLAKDIRNMERTVKDKLASQYSNVYNSPF